MLMFEPTKTKPTNPQLISYLTLRKIIGILGIAFPILLILGSVALFGCQEVQGSISAYYHTDMRNLFVGVLCAIGLFLLTYTGYDSTDATAGNIACLFALGVALCPTGYDGPINTCIAELHPEGIVSTIHFISAAGLFLTLSYFSLCRFTKTSQKPEKCWKRLQIKNHENRPTGRKLIRNRIYVACGLIMIGCILLIGIYQLLSDTSFGEVLSKLKPVFWLETLALWAFGFSWLTKGNAVFADKA